jgi:hypothetical protein
MIFIARITLVCTVTFDFEYLLKKLLDGIKQIDSNDGDAERLVIVLDVEPMITAVTPV